MERVIPEEGLEKTLELAWSFHGGIGLYLMAGLLAGMRLTETVRLVVSRRVGTFKITDTGIVGVGVDVGPDAKNNMRGTRFLPSRTAYLPEVWRTRLRGVHLPWEVTEAEASQYVKDFSKMVHVGMGINDVRVFRRGMAVRVRDKAVAEGETEKAAVAWARMALGHREDSKTVFRYLGGEVSAEGARRLGGMQRPDGIME